MALGKLAKCHRGDRSPTGKRQLLTAKAAKSAKEIQK
jgi:hypothetical protein